MSVSISLDGLIECCLHVNFKVLLILDEQHAATFQKMKEREKKVE